MAYAGTAERGGGTFALELESGRRVWHTAPQCDDKTNEAKSNAVQQRCPTAQMGAVTGIPGVIFSSSRDGHLRACSTRDGHVIWTNSTAREYDTVNGQ